MLSVVDPDSDPWDSYVFGPPGSGSESVIILFRIRFLPSTSKKSTKNLDFYYFVTCFWLFIYENWKLKKNLFYAGVLWATDEKNGIRIWILIRTKMSRSSTTLAFVLNFLSESHIFLYIYSLVLYFVTYFVSRNLHSWGSNSQPELFQATSVHSKLCNAEIILFNRFLMHFEQAVCEMGEGFNCLCPSLYSPGFNLSILQHGGIWGVAEEALLKKLLSKTYFNLKYI
jgi:hypothetical protein